MIISAIVMSLSLMVFSKDVASEIQNGSAPEQRNGPVKDGGLESEVEKTIRKAFEDNSWLAFSTEKELKRYCETIYSPEIRDDMALRLLEFCEGNNDWHTAAEVCSIQEITRGADEIEVGISIQYFDLNFLHTGELTFANSGRDDFIVLLTRKGDSFRIKRILKHDNLGQQVDLTS